MTTENEVCDTAWLQRFMIKSTLHLDLVEFIHWSSFTISFGMLIHYCWMTHKGLLKIGFIHVMFFIICFVEGFFSIFITLDYKNYMELDMYSLNRLETFYMLSQQLETLVISYMIWLLAIRFKQVEVQITKDTNLTTYWMF